jgi:glycosyltransferase involved in cell wall biosynthesis
MPYAGTSGGWIVSNYEELKEKDIEFSFLCSSKEIKTGTSIQKESILGSACCVCMPKASFGTILPDADFKIIQEYVDKIKPDLIHIWGTEMAVTNAVAKCAPQIPKVVFIQGIIGIHDRYYGGELKSLHIKPEESIKEKLISRVKKKAFHKQIAYEQEELKNAGNVIIDNDFSRAYIYSISPSIKTFTYRLTPNQAFEDTEWNQKSLGKQVIFTICGSGTDKGLHQLVKAIGILHQEFPNIEVRVPGAFNCTSDGRLSKSINMTAYEKTLLRLMEENGVTEQFRFIGKQTPKQMADNLKECSLFVNPSCMEVHAGSLREAMLVGVPSISSFCGSVGEFLIEGQNGMLYRYKEYEVLAYKIRKVLQNPELALTMGKNARIQMQKLNGIGYSSLADIYTEIINNKGEM